jgi:hypothetical protein
MMAEAGGGQVFPIPNPNLNLALPSHSGSKWPNVECRRPKEIRVTKSESRPRPAGQANCGWMHLIAANCTQLQHRRGWGRKSKVQSLKSKVQTPKAFASGEKAESRMAKSRAAPKSQVRSHSEGAFEAGAASAAFWLARRNQAQSSRVKLSQTFEIESERNVEPFD